ncbi:hypothetical protein CI102_8158 [Trichoderma harzianum]|nr:hypothetical protein CI102_8158 [Trichoderma harzianum]
MQVHFSCTMTGRKVVRERKRRRRRRRRRRGRRKRRTLDYSASKQVLVWSYHLPADTDNWKPRSPFARLISGYGIPRFGLFVPDGQPASAT